MVCGVTGVRYRFPVSQLGEDVYATKVGGNHNSAAVQGAVSLTYLSILKEGFTPIFSATLSYGRKSVSP